MESLPEETVLQILAECETPPQNEVDWDKEMPEFYKWTRLTHICCYWREVALSSPLLWTGVLMSESTESKWNSAAASFLERSKGLPLRVYVHVPSSFQTTGTHRFTAILQKAIPRAGELHIRLRREEALESFWLKFYVGAPLLSTFHVVCSVQRAKAPQNLGIGRDILPGYNMLFRDELPSLRTVRIRGVTIAKRHILIRPGLDRLEYSQHPSDAFPLRKLHLPFIYFYVGDFAAASFSLTHLTLCGPGDVEGSLPVDSTFFPSLQSVSVTGQTSYVVHQLYAMTFPSETSVHIHLQYDVNLYSPWHPLDSDQPSEWTPILADWMHELVADSSPIRTISIAGDGAHEHGFWTTSPVPTSTGRRRGSNCLSPRLSFVNCKEPQRRIDMAELTGRLSLSAVDTLILRDVAIDFDIWGPVLAKLHDLHSVEAWGSSAGSLVRLLSPIPASVPFPFVRRARLVEVDCVQGGLLQELEQVLSVRTRLQATRLEELNLYGCVGVMDGNVSQVQNFSRVAERIKILF